MPDTLNLNHGFDGCKYCFNPFAKENPSWTGEEFSFLERSDMLDFHRSLAGYAPTPLLSVPKIAAALGVKEIYVKDESHRFGIKAFKACGASYAIFRFLKAQWENRFRTPFTIDSFKHPGVLRQLGAYTFCAATDGNHGRAVAWTARILGQKAVIYMPKNTAQARIENVTGEGARVEQVEGTFDDCVIQCASDAEKNGWHAISDTAYEGYMDVPRSIMLGYTTLFHEIEATMNHENLPGVDFVILPAGVGGLAAAGTGYYVRKYGKTRPYLICVEPSDCDCFLESVKYGNGQPLPTRGKQTSIMVGLNCGIPSPVAWPIIRDGMHLFTAITDNYAVDAMRAYYTGNITSGESGSAGLACLMALVRDKDLKEAREKIGLTAHSRVLLINTEGDTDPTAWRSICRA